jgi:cytoskeletal protein CcmA (bactofilin family)
MSGEDRRKEYERELQNTDGFPTARISGSGKVHIPGVGTIHISGSGTVSQDEIRISGSGKLPGGLKVRSLRCSGSVSVDGDIEAEDMSFSGSASVHGNATAGMLSAAGSFSVHGKARVGTMEATGSCSAYEGIEAEDTLRVAGFLRVSTDVRAKKLVELRGIFDVGGRIVTDRFEARLGRPSRPDSQVSGGIQAISVDVRKKETRSSWILSVPFLRRLLREGRLYTTNIIAEDRVCLENVSCDNVQGSNVTIGEGCVIRGKVSYSETVSVHSAVRLPSAPQKLS